MNFKPRCGKICYPSRSEAKKAMRIINHNYKLDKKMTDAYYCEDCSAFHLTSLNKQRSRDYNRHLNKKK